MATFPNPNISFKPNNTFIVFLLGMLISVNTLGTSNWTLVAEDACYSATTFLTDNTFNSPHSGNVTAVKLVWTEGDWVGCESGSGATYQRSWGIWGCSDPYFQVQLVMHTGSMVKTVLPTNNTVDVTEIDTFWNHDYVDDDWYSISSWCDNGNGCSVWQYKMDGVTVTDSELVWTDTALNLDVSVDDTFSLQYGEGCCDLTTDDNLQGACVDVYFQFASTISPSNDSSDEPTSVPSTDPTKVPTIFEPTANPNTGATSDTTTDPTVDPTVDPTSESSSEPTVFPTNYPSADPTEAPSTHFCQSIRIDIIDFDGFDSDDLNDDELLQEEVANVTHHALAQTAFTANYGIDIDSFYVVYEDSLDAHVYENGNVQQSVHIDEILCAFEAADSNLLTEMIENEAGMIGSIISQRLAALHLEGQTSDTMTVSITGPNAFSLPLKIVDGAMSSVIHLCYEIS